MSVKTKQQINKDYYLSKKDTLIQCKECMMPIKYQSFKAHLKTDKHIANCKMQKASYLDTLKGAVAKLVDGCNIESVSKEIYYIIQQEYFLGQPAAPKDKKDATPQVIVISQDQKRAEALYEEIMALYDKRWDMLAENAHYERNKEKFHKDVIRINERYEKLEKEINKEQNTFRSYDIFKKDAMNYMTRVKECLITQIEKMKAKMIEVVQPEEQEQQQEQQQTVKVIGAVENDDEDAEDDEDDEEQDEDDYGNDTYKIDDTDFTTAFFPALYEFRDLKKSMQEIVLEKIAVNCADIFEDDKRFVIERIYQALTERDKLQYQILYDDIFTFYQRYKVQVESYQKSDTSSDTQSTNGDEEQELFEYDFKY